MDRINTDTIDQDRMQILHQDHGSMKNNASGSLFFTRSRVGEKQCESVYSESVYTHAHNTLNTNKPATNWPIPEA